MNRTPVSQKQQKDNVRIQDMKSPTISNACALAILIIGTLLICLIIILNVLIDTPLFIKGVNFIYNYQQAIPSKAFRIVQIIFTVMCEPFCIGIIMLIYYIVVNRKLLLIVHTSYFLFATYIIALLKQAFQQSRPIWYDSRIQFLDWVCPKDFGNPSGHSFAVILLYQPIISDSIGYWKYRPWGYVLSILFIMIPISRMYLGVHSLNQILFGLSLGTVFLVLYKYIYQKALYELYWQFLLGNAKRIKIIGIYLLHIFVILIPIIFYYINAKQRPMLQKDVDNLNNRCGTNLLGVQVQAKMMNACSLGCFVFGLIYGFVLLANEPGYRKYLMGLWQYEDYCKILLKIGIYLVCAGVPAIIFIGIAKLFVHNVYVNYILHCIALTAVGFGLSYLAPILTMKCKITKLLPGSAQDYQHQLDQIH